MPASTTRAAATAAAVALVLAAPALAGPLVITPTTVTIEPGRHSAVVEVENASDEPVDLQFRAYDWSQTEGQERLSPTDTLVVSPPIASVAAHGKQVFRVLQTAGPLLPGERERSYRLRLNQLPRDDRPAVAILVEFSLPVFQGQAGAAPQLSWTLDGDVVTVTNSGARRARLGGLTLTGADVAAVSVPGAASAYLLSGAKRSFRLSATPAAGNDLRLVATTDTGTLDASPTALASR